MRLGARYTSLDDDTLLSRTAQLLAEENVIGWFQGRMEFGPRALGGRSIIGDPRSAKMQSVMNLKIKYRESFRPFAPSVLWERVSDYFEQDAPSPYMLIVAPVHEKLRIALTDQQKALFGIEKLKLTRSELPAITHVDYSARVQTVHAETNPRYHALLKAFEGLTGVRRPREYLVQRARRACCLHARPMPIAASCAPRWITWSWRISCWTRKSSPPGKTTRPGKTNSSSTEMAADHRIPELDRKGLRDFGLTTGAAVVVFLACFSRGCSSATGRPGRGPGQRSGRWPCSGRRGCARFIAHGCASACSRAA